MFSITILLALPLLAIASPHIISRKDDGTSSCGTAPIQCCNATYKPTSSEGRALLKAYNLESHPDAHHGVIAEGCNTGIGILNGGACSGTPTCCASGNSVVSIGCITVTP